MTEEEIEPIIAHGDDGYEWPCRGKCKKLFVPKFFKPEGAETGYFPTLCSTCCVENLMEILEPETPKLPEKTP